MPHALIFLMTAISYFYFNRCYFTLVTEALELPKMRRGYMLCTFLVNFTVFFLCSVAEFNLILNWLLFFVFLYMETYFYCRKSWQQVLYFSLMGILCGLAFNIVCRCAAAIIMDLPLTSFDNHVSGMENYKGVPVALGFLFGGAALHLMARLSYLKRLRELIRHDSHLPFHLELTGVMFLYLFLNLLLYQSDQNSLVLKLWGIKSCLFALAGTFLGMRYSLKICELSDYRDQNRTMRRELNQKEEEEKDLQNIAYRDALTGAYNRQYAIRTARRFLEDHSRFTLCYIDLDDLKGVNDRFGHTEGDRYLQAAAQALAGCCRRKEDLLFRFGGDEFLMIFRGLSASEAEQCLYRACRQLEELGKEETFPFPMSVSFGAVESSETADIQKLIEAADEKMYLQKKKKHKQ